MDITITGPEWIDLEVTGEDTGIPYQGRFQIKPFITHDERRDAHALAERYNLGVTDPELYAFHLTLAYLKFHIVEKVCTWWDNDGLKLHDQTPVLALSDEIAKIRVKRNPKLNKEKSNEAPKV